MTFAAPVTHDNIFFYGSLGLYVEVVTTSTPQPHRHTRADYSHLYRLLTYAEPGPVLTKKGTVAKRQPPAPIHPPHKDETEHFYCAQLLHYGLKPLKTKAAAKKQLLAAFGSGTTLKVPDHIARLERELKKEFKLEEVKAKREQEDAATKKRGGTKKSQGKDTSAIGIPSGGKAASSSKKRKADDDVAAGLVKRSKGDKKAGGAKLSSLDVCGVWEISCPWLSDNYDEANDDLSMTMSPSRHTGGHLWISFDFGLISGIMRCSAPPTTTTQACTFTWRGCEAGEGTVSFDRYNVGTITFLGKGKLRGVMSGAWIGEDIEFSGTQDTENLRNVVWTKHVKEWKAGWRGMNENAQEAENQARWGNWVSRDGCIEGPADSDTTAQGEGPGQAEPDDFYDDY